MTLENLIVTLEN